ncbi:hypothetical protein D3C86_1724080 [compost metagenome]
MVECRDGRDHAERFVLGEGHPVGRSGVQSHRDHVAAFGAQHFDAIEDTVDTTLDFGDRIFQRLAAFAGRLGSNRHLARTDQFGGALQDFNPPRLGQPLAAVAEDAMGNTQRLLDIGLGGNRHVTDDSAIERGVHSQGLFRHGSYLESYEKWRFRPVCLSNLGPR